MLRLMAAFLQRFCDSRRGAIALMAAAAIPLLLLTASGAVDFASIYKHRSALQSAADAAAIAGARGLSMSDAKQDNVDAVVKAVVNHAVSSNASQNSSQIKVSSQVTRSPLEVAVSVSQTFPTFFGKVFGMSDMVVSAQATARVIGQPHICVLGLNRYASGTISLEKQARVTGQNCAVFSNSSHVNSIKSKNSSNLTADLICSRGGKDGTKGNFTPEPITDCPGFEDPLAGRPEPPVGGCTHSKRLFITASQSLSPGVYCGGITIESDARVELKPGIYVIKDGSLDVTLGGQLIGKEVGLYFTGKGASLLFDRDSTISLEAPRTGVMAGLLMFASRSLGKERFKIMSDDARVLLGTIYLPTSELYVDAGSPIADKSAYTAIVADTMRLYGGPHLFLNTGYDETEVPVPNGIKGVGQPVRLWK